MGKSTPFRPGPLLLAVLAALSAAPAIAQTSPGEVVVEHPSAIVTPEARAVLDRMKAYLNSQQSFTIQAQASRDEMLGYGYKLQNNEWATMTVQRPNRMRVDLDGDIKKRSYFYDGTTLTMYSPDDAVYSKVAAPGTIGEVITQLLDAGVEMPLIDVLAQAYGGTLLEDVRVGLRVGDTTIDGVVTDHLAFRQPLIDWQLWVAKNGAPKRILITTRYTLGDPQYEVGLDWKENVRPPASTFSFSPPEGVREIPATRPPQAPAPSAGSP
jgi:hypothetical protein